MGCRNKSRQASVRREKKVSNVGGNFKGRHGSPGIWRGKMPIMAYFPAVKNIKTHFKNVVLTTAIPGLQPRRAAGANE